MYLKWLLIFCLTVPVLLTSCRRSETVFRQVDAGESGLNFNNTITETEALNPLTRSLMYNGAGVAVGDFNNDGLPDLFFCGNQVKNALYLNKGHLKFTDVTSQSGVGANGEWCGGAAVVDINNDGLPDIYVCTSMKLPGSHTHNLLYVNQGTGKGGIPVFKEMAAEYGLADTGDGVMAAFFDFDNDGDLDMYLTRTTEPDATTRYFKKTDSTKNYPSADKLYRNDWNAKLHHPVFTDVSAKAGIKEEGFGLGLAIADINGDGWKDIYVTNDYNGSDQLYINNGNGTFTNKVHQYFKHTSFNAMGNDIADLNNDGLPDAVALDMDAEDNYRKKMNMDGNDQNGFYNMYAFNYEPQFVRNTLQFNQGSIIGRDGKKGDPVFSEIGYYSGIAATDWSWSVLCADFDNDGKKDVAITNGYPRDITDHDYIAYLYQNTRQAYALSNADPGASHISKQELTKDIPRIKICNYLFKNAGDMRFQDVSRQWGITTPSFSSGAVYADLDNDGDLDYVVSNVNDKAMLFENTTINKDVVNGNYLRVQFKGDTANRNGIGAKVTVYFNGGEKQVVENSPYRGYLSTTEAIAHFGLGKTTAIDSMLIEWPGNQHLVQWLKNIRSNQVITVDINNARPGSIVQPRVQSLFQNVSDTKGVNIINDNGEFFEFQSQRLLPHEYEQYGPCMAVGDVNGDGLDDIFVCGSSKANGYFLIQKTDGTFSRTILPDDSPFKPEQMACLLFDADGDGDLDLYVTCGSYGNLPIPKQFNDRLYLNDGHGHFTLLATILPADRSYRMCIKAADFNHDGKLDLFIGSRGIPGQYPLAGESRILRNDSHDNIVKFTDVTAQVAPALKNGGMIADALWTDIDNDGWVDLITVGEWSAPQILRNHKGVFNDVGTLSDATKQTGWWNSITACDINNDGLTDYILGNLGENSFYKASENYPVSIYAKDIDGNGSIDPLITSWLISKKNDDGSNGAVKEFTAQNRDDILAQLPGVKKNYLSYQSFANAAFEDIFPKQLLQGAMVKKAVRMSNSVMINKGNNRFEMRSLPYQAQLAPVFGVVCDDFDGDGNEDVLLAGNDHGAEVSMGPYDAFNGLVLKGDGKGGFSTLKLQQSGVYIPGDAKAAVSLLAGRSAYSIAVSQNRGPLQYFELQHKNNMVLRLRPGDAAVLLTYFDGHIRKKEIGYGSSALSQSGRFCLIDKSVKSVTITDFSGYVRTISYSSK